MENEIKENEIDLLSLVGILVRNKWIVLLSTTLFFIGSTLYVYITKQIDPSKSPMPDVYIVESTVLLGSTSGNSSGVMGALSAAGLGSLANLAGGGSGGPSSSSMIQLISKSKNFQDEMTRELDLVNYLGYPPETPVKSLRGFINKGLTLEFDNSTNSMKISYQSTDPLLAYNVVEKMVRVLSSQMDIVSKMSQKNDKQDLEMQRALLEARLRELEEQIINFQKTNNFLDANSIASVATSSATQARTELIKLESEIQIMNKKVRPEDPQLQQLLTEQEIQNHFLDNLYTTGGYGIPPYSQIPNLLIDFTKLETEYKMQSKVLASIVEQLELLKLTTDVSSSNFQVLDYPERPEGISGPNRKKLIIVGILAGFLLGIVAIFIIEFIKSIWKDEHKIKRITGEKK